MKTKILDYIDFDKVNTLLEGFNLSTGFVTAILDLEGNILSKSGWREICTEFHRVNPATSERCTKSDTILAGELGKGEKYHFYQCLNGLVDVAVPVIIKGEHIANLFSGQFFFEKPDISFFQSQAEKYGFNQKDYLKALEEVPVFSQEKVKNVMEFLLNMTQLISDMTLQRLELMELNDTLRTNEERYRLVLENSMDAILLTSPDGSILSANPAACKMFQRSEEEICQVGRNGIVDTSDHRLYALIEERNQTGKTKGEVMMLRKDGNKFPVELSTSVFTDHSGNLLSSLVIRDITERKNTEEQLLIAKQKAEDSEEKFRLMIKNSNDAFVLINQNGEQIYISDASVRDTGFAIEELKGSIKNVIYPDDLDEVLKAFNEVLLNKEKTVRVQYRHKHKYKEYIWYEAVAQNFIDNPAINAVVVNVRDISAIKETEAELIKAKERAEESEMHFRLLVENAPEAIFIQVDSKFAYLNKAAIKLYGAANEEQLIGTKVTERIHPDFHEMIVNRIKELNEQQLSVNTYEYKHLKIDGTVIEVSESAVPFKFHNEQGALVFVSDITDRKQAEELYKQKTEEINTFFDCALDLLCIANTDGLFIHLNKEWENVLGYGLDELVNSKFIDFIHPDDLQPSLQAIEQLSNQEKILSFTNRYRCKNGEYKWIEWKSYPIGNKIYAAARDITERIQQKQDLIKAKEKIEKSEEKFRKAFFTNPEAITITNIENGTYVSVNNGFIKMFEYSEAETLGHTSKELNIWREISERDYFIDTLKKYHIIEDFETKFRTKSGKILDCNVSSVVIELDNIPHILSITRDISYRKKVENELRESKEQLYFAFEGSNDGLWDVNMKTGEAYINSRGCEILGYKPDEMEEVAKIWSDLVHPEDLPLTNNYLQAHIENKTPVFEVEQRLRMKSGEWKWILSRGKVVSRDTNGIPIRMTGTHTDISERIAFKGALIQKNIELEFSREEIRVANEQLKEIYESLKETNVELEIAKEKAEEKEKHFSAAFYSHPFPLSIVTVPEGKIIEVNNVCCNFYGYTREQLLNFTTEELHLWDSDFNFAKALKELATTENLKLLEANINTASNEIRTILLSAEPIIWNGEKCYITSTIDITERKLLENELVNAKEKAEESNRLKTAFLQNMSHEIRTPMNAIIGFSELLARNFNNKQKLENFAGIITQRCNDLLIIIDDILDIAKIESGQLPVKIETCNINDLFRELSLFYSELQIKQKKQHISLNIHPGNPSGIKMQSDIGKLKQIFINLIGNAFKFTESGSIDVSYRMEQDQFITFFVSDTGIGIPRNKQQIIFERFMQVEQAPNRLFGGTGLGLSIVKGLIGLLNGKIWLESELGKGTIFYFSLPYNPIEKYEEIPQKTNKVSVEISLTRKTILIVEDDLYNAEYIIEVLSDTGLKILHAQLGSEAIQIATSQKPDLVLMDIGLPDISGYEAIRQIKQKMPHLKIIAQTAYAAASDKQKALESGCVDYISKPLKPELLLSLINRHLS